MDSVLRNKLARLDRWRIAMIVVPPVVAMVWLMLTSEFEATVADFGWQRTLHIERLTAVHGEGWSLPGGDARITRTEQKIHHHEQVTEWGPHWNFSKGEYDFGPHQVDGPPVYRPYYFYVLPRWKWSRDKNTTGTTFETAWPDEGDIRTGGDFGCDRVSSKAERYTVTVVANGKTGAVAVPYDEWLRFEPGERVKVRTMFRWWWRKIEKLEDK